MNQPSHKSDNLIRTTALFLLLGLIITLMILARTILIPLAWAMLFAFIMFPLCEWLEKKGLPRSVSSLIGTLVFSLISGVIMFYLVYQAVHILQQEGSVLSNVKSGFESVQSWLYDKFGLTIFNPEEGPSSPTDYLGKIVNFVASEVSTIGQNIVTITLIPMFLFFLLLYRGLANKFVQHRYKGEQRKHVEEFFEKSRFSIQNYLWGTLLLTAVTTVMGIIILMLFGIKYAFFFAIFIAVLNLIPYIGNLAAFIVVLLFVWVTKQSGYTVLFVGACLYGSNLLQENFLRPKLIGDKMEMNAMVVFSAVIVGSMIWGFSGMVLFIPLLGALKAMFDSNPRWEAYSIFFEDGDDGKSKKKKSSVIEKNRKDNPEDSR